MVSTIREKPPRSFNRAAEHTGHHYQTGWCAVLLGFAICALLWIVSGPTRETYVPNNIDIPALADGLLLAPGAHWQDWFTQGYSHYFDGYPEWPRGNMGFTRPAFQFLIYLTHFALGRNWESYQIISCLTAAGVAVAAFLIARTTLRLGTGLSLLAAALVVLSPPVLDCWLNGLANAHEPLATLLVAGAFLAIVARRDFICLIFLFVAVLSKENALWAPAAAAITILMRPKPDESFRRRAAAAAAMFLPVVFWVGLRFTFFDGIGGTYATARYTPLADYLHLSFQKLTHLDALFIGQNAFATEGQGTYRVVTLGTRLLIYSLFSLLALQFMAEFASRLRHALYKRSWPTADGTFLVSLWAAIALAFHFALALSSARYATSVAVFAWPALVAEIDRRRHAVIWVALALFCMAVSARAYRSLELALSTHEFSLITTALRQLPSGTRQVYVLPASYSFDNFPFVDPEYLRLILGVPAEIVRIMDFDWKCSDSNTPVAFDHSIADGVVNLTVTLPDCANFVFWPPLGDKVANGHLYRGETMSYELPEVARIEAAQPYFSIGRNMTVHIRPNGPARFIIQQGVPNGIAWFDTP